VKDHLLFLLLTKSDPSHHRKVPPRGIAPPSGALAANNRGDQRDSTCQTLWR